MPGGKLSIDAWLDLSLSFSTEELCADLWCAAEDVNMWRSRLGLLCRAKVWRAQKRHEPMVNIYIMYELISLVLRSTKSDTRRRQLKKGDIPAAAQRRRAPSRRC